LIRPWPHQYTDGETGIVIRVGEIVKEWRELRRLSQLDLALEADISQKHLSFIE
jgi:ribosome-binding protein aMBF1 (putative translation factor)